MQTPPPEPIFSPAAAGPFRVIVSGGQDYLYPDLVFAALDAAHALRPFSVVVHGGDHGAADRLAGQWAAARGIPTEVHEAPFVRRGQKAEAVRNQRMVAGGADACIVFPGWLATDLNDRASKAGIPTWRPYGWKMPEITSGTAFSSRTKYR